MPITPYLFGARPNGKKSAAHNGIASVSIALAATLQARQFRPRRRSDRSEEHTSELQSLMRISYAVFCLKKKIPSPDHRHPHHTPDNLQHLTNTRPHRLVRHTTAH